AGGVGPAGIPTPPPQTLSAQGPPREAGATEFLPGIGDAATLAISRSGLRLDPTRHGPDSPSDAETLDTPSSRPADSPAPPRPVAPVGYPPVPALGRGGMGLGCKARQLCPVPYV